VVAGFHLDGITREQIDEVVANSNIGITRILAAIEEKTNECGIGNTGSSI
jgi:hypothetical protein